MSTEQDDADVPTKKLKVDDSKCIKCNVFLRKLPGKPKIITSNDEILISQILKKSCKSDEKLCQKCWKIINKSLLKEKQALLMTETPPVDDVRTYAQDQPSTSTHNVMGGIRETDCSADEHLPSQVSTSKVLIMPSSFLDTQIITTETSFLSNREDSIEEELLESQNSFQSLFITSTSSSSVGSQNVQAQTSSGSEYIYESPETEDIEYVDMPFSRVIATHKYCFICRQDKHLAIVPSEARLQVFAEKQIMIPKGNRCCKIHMIKNRFYKDELQNIHAISDSCRMEVKDLGAFMEQLSVRADSSIHARIGRYTMSDEKMQTLTSLTWDNINYLAEQLTSMRKSESRNVIQALVVFLFKLRTGNSNALISAILGLDREQQVSDFVESVLKSFERDILPKNFGVGAVTRDYLIQNETAIVAQKLHNINNQLMIICDGTYYRHQKSRNNEYQRKSYSVQKSTSLCKPFTICTTNGYVVDMAGPFYANQNDATILKIIMSQEHHLSSLLQEGDIFVLDRGFRDIKSELEQMGYKVLMPALKGKRKQLTAKESNESRLVTKVRWPVEAVHGVIGKKYNLLHNQLDNKLLPKAEMLCKVACYLNNTFGKRFNSDQDMVNEIVDQIKNRVSVENTLADEIESEHWNRKTVPFQKITSLDLEDFPEITEKELKIFFTGTYQYSQSISYLAEMLDEDNKIDVSFLKESPNIVKFSVQSRHKKRQSYKCFVEYVPNSVGKSGIKRYACECANGRRTIGCCAHVAAVIYYLSYARYLSRIVRPAEKLKNIFDVENIVPTIENDSDDDE